MSEFKEWFKKQYYCYGEEEYAKSAWNHQQAKINELTKHVACIKTIVSECDENTDSSWILGNIDGFIECAEKIINESN